jgi:hypothetical protein
LKAQQVVSSGGGQGAGSGVRISWTIGEPVISTLRSGSLILTQGFHQTRLSLTAIEEIPVPGLKLSVFPNPTAEFINLKIEEGDFALFQYTLLDINGKSLKTNKLKEASTRVDMGKLAAGIYLLRISRKNGETIKTCRVVKQ